MFDTTHLHPMIVHFPIALLIIGFLFDLTGAIFNKVFFSKAGFYLLILGTLGVIAAFISGNIAGDGVSEVGTLKQALENHEDAAQLSLWLMVTASICKNCHCSAKEIFRCFQMGRYSFVFSWNSFYCKNRILWR